MIPKLQISQSVITRLEHVGGQNDGAVYGTMYDNALLVLGLTVNTVGDAATVYQEMQTHFPTEVDFCGVVISTEETDNHHLSIPTLDILKEVLVTDNPLVIKRSVNSGALRAYFYCNEKLFEVDYQVLSETDICERFVHVRLRTHIQLVCEPEPTTILEAINNLQKKVSSGSVAFHVSKTNVYLFGTEMRDCVMMNDLVELAGLTDTRKKHNATLEHADTVNVSVLQKSTRDRLSEELNKQAPVIHHAKYDKTLLQVQLPIDHLALVHVGRHVAELYNVLVDTLCRSLRIFERCLSHSHKCLGLPRAYHFLPPSLGHFFTMIYISNRSDKELESTREKFHNELGLAKDRPVFRKGNVHIFRQDILANAPLVNPHLGLRSSGAGGEVSVVSGRYSYYHYLQDSVEDSGWGCAYRSLQTVVSWFRHQGYTERSVPTHREIQQCLVDIGDKQPGFVGSRQWIGSTEVSFCLDMMLGITCRILTVASGVELQERGTDLAKHFSTHGTPVMIGGGVLAHTILGVDLNRDTDELQFLVLDPHYSGADDLKHVLQKGGVAWKKLDFWTKNAFYNMCLPLRPVCF